MSNSAFFSGNPMLALAMNGGLPGGAGMPAGPMAMPTPPTPPTPLTNPPTPAPSGRRRAGVVSKGAAKSPNARRPPKPAPTQVSAADAALGVISRMPMTQPTPSSMGIVSMAAGAPGMQGGVAGPAGAADAAAMAGMASMMNPMGPGRPFVHGLYIFLLTLLFLKAKP